MTGTVKCFFPEKGYGFILPAERCGIDYFYHIREVQDRLVLKVGDEVVFDVGTDARSGRECAKDVRTAKQQLTRDYAMVFPEPEEE
jgi:cold shock CspA family protein